MPVCGKMSLCLWLRSSLRWCGGAEVVLKRTRLGAWLLPSKGSVAEQLTGSQRLGETVLGTEAGVGIPTAEEQSVASSGAMG